MKVLAVIQVRMGSVRLADKAFLPIEGRGAVEHVAERLEHCREIDEVVLSTSSLPKDDVLAELAATIGIPCFRDSETDLIQRHLGAARAFAADAVLRVTGDCPLVDPRLADRMIRIWRDAPDAWELITNACPATFPDGLDLEVLPTSTLQRMDREITNPTHREWLTTQVMRHADNWRIHNVSHEPSLVHLRWTLDFPEDLALIRAIYAELGAREPFFDMQDVLDLFERRPDLSAINAMHVDDEIKDNIRSKAYHELRPDDAAGAGGDDTAGAGGSA